MKQILKSEKKQTNGIRWKYNAFLFALLAIFIVCGIIALVLLEVDEKKFFVPSICLIAVGSVCFCSLLPLIFFPPIRNRETTIELKRYDFDKKTETKESYLFESTTVEAIFETENPPFAETIETVTGTGRAALEETLRSILGERYTEIPMDEADENSQKFSVCDLRSRNLNQIPFEINQSIQPNGKLRVTVSTKNSLCFRKDGVALNGVEYPYCETTTFLQTSNFLMRVRLTLQIHLGDDAHALIPLDAELLHIVDRFAIDVENREILNYIVQNKEKAFRQILKYGRIKKLK